ncbi:MAG TPA: methyltransferase domain-containing protein [Syntrophorhabdaceae bacterium]|jgi:ubiquinone/menaquinone biosynthesis C-methylase UbiE
MRDDHSLKSVPTRGRTLDHAAFVYDLLEPVLMLGKAAQYNQKIISLLDPAGPDRVLDLGCGTGVLTCAIGERLDHEKGGISIGIDAAAKMINLARKKRESRTCRFEVAAAESLPFESSSFDAVVSSMFFHHVPLDLKKKALAEARRVLKTGGKLVIADMHAPVTVFGSLVSHVSRYFFMQPQIGENIKGLLPRLIEEAGFNPPLPAAMYFGYIAIFVSQKEG